MTYGPQQGIRLTTDQVQSIVRAAKEGGTENVVVLVPELAHRQLPPTALWAQRIREDTDARLSLPLACGLLFLARLVEGGPADLDDLAPVLQLSAGVIGRYAHTLVLAGLVERDSDTSRYRLVR